MTTSRETKPGTPQFGRLGVSLCSVLLAAAATLPATHCRRELRMHGALAALSDSVHVSRAGKQCRRDVPLPGFGVALGCWQDVRDTLAYAFFDSTGLVQLVGREWGFDAESTWTRLEASLRSIYGVPSDCSHAEAQWAIRDRRWTATGYHVALLDFKPLGDLALGRRVRLVFKLGSPNCSEYYGAPGER